MEVVGETIPRNLECQAVGIFHGQARDADRERGGRLWCPCRCEQVVRDRIGIRLHARMLIFGREGEQDVPGLVTEAWQPDS